MAVPTGLRAGMSHYDGPAVLRNDEARFDVEVHLWRSRDWIGHISWGGEVDAPNPAPTLRNGGAFSIEIPGAEIGTVLLSSASFAGADAASYMIIRGRGTGDPPFGDAAAGGG